jgi:uncharacterized protein
MPPIPVRRLRLGLGARLGLLVCGALLMARAAHAQPVCGGADLLPGLASSQPALHAEVLHVARSEPNGEALLWKITPVAGDGPDRPPSWLFGTIHLTDARVHALPKSVREALGGAHTLALEIADISPKAMQKAFAANPGLIEPRKDREIKAVFSAPERQALEAAAGSLGISAVHAQAMRPWFLATLLSRPACEGARESAGFKPLDLVLRDQALARKARVVGLESIGDQLRAMGELPAATEIAWLRAGIHLFPRIDDLTETLVQLYLKRRIGATWVLSQGLSGDAALTAGQLRDIQDALVVRRNRKMADAALPLLKEGGVFIGVGALHLPGREGLVQLLREAGYAVTAVE